MSFRLASENGFEELDSRSKQVIDPLTFGIDFLDHATMGIFPGDLILMGSPPGVGKTQFCCNLAIANAARGKRVHYIALEAEEFEIERRMKYQILAQKYFAMTVRPQLKNGLNYPEWYLGRFFNELRELEDLTTREFVERSKGLSVFYKTNKFGLNELIQQVISISNDTDLIIIDHVHYFDFDDDNEHRALREIAKTARTLALEEHKPIVMVAHLRKRDRANNSLVADMDEFHGTSELYKIATKVVTFSGGKPTVDGRYETFFRIPKNRLNGGVTRYIGRVLFDPKETSYDTKYRIGLSTQTTNGEFENLDDNVVPSWVDRQSLLVGGLCDVPQRQPEGVAKYRGPNFAKVVSRPYKEN